LKATPSWYNEKVNSYETVPCLYENGKGIFESLNVVEYLHDEHGADLLPKSSYERALARETISKFEVGVYYRLLLCEELEKQQEIKHEILEELKFLNKLYSRGRINNKSHGPYYFGDKLSMVDIAIFPFLERYSALLKHYRDFDLLSEDNHDVDRLREGLEAVRKRPAFIRTTQPAEFFVNYSSFKTNKQLREEKV